MNNEDGQHQLIARLFYSDMVSILERSAAIHKKSFANKEIAESLGWPGLQETNAYKELNYEHKKIIGSTILKDKGIDMETD